MTQTSGFLCINKPTGKTSFEIVSQAKRILGTKKVGHLGTIDKAGAGVLPLAVGNATKFFDYFLTKNKEYLAYFAFGFQTDTLDSYGNITTTNNKKITKEQLQEAAKTFLGQQMQLPPQYSALKVNGKRAAERATQGQEVQLKPRPITIHSFDVLNEVYPNVFLVKIGCSAGTYIRSIMRDIALKLNTCGTMVAIIRTISGAFSIHNSITPDQISWQNVMPISSVVSADELNNEKLIKLLNSNNE